MEKYTMVNPQFFTKKNWEGIQLRHGFDNSYGHRMHKPRRLFYKECREKQYQVAELFNSKELLAKPQLAPFFLFPGNELSAHAAIGWTVFLEYQSQLKKIGRQPSQEIETFLKSHFLGTLMAPKVLEKFSKAIAETLNTKLGLEALSRKTEFKEVEIYRVLTCNLMDPTLYSSIEQTLRWSILYDDLLPDSTEKSLNTGVKELFEKLRKVNTPFLFELKKIGEAEFLQLGKQWAEAILKAISYAYNINQMGLVELKSRDKEHAGHLVPITVEESKDPASSLLPYIDKEEIEDVLGSENMNSMKKLVEDLHEAAEKPKLWEEPKPDRISLSINDPFSAVPQFEGEWQECEYFEIDAENGQQLSGEVMEESLPVSYDEKAIAQIQFLAEPIAEELNKILYKNSEKTTDYKISNSGNSFQNNLISHYKFKDQIFKKTTTNHRTSKGKPLVALLVDMSGSMKGAPLECTKIITAAWSMRKDMKLVAATYTTTNTPQGVRPIVRWISHPKNKSGASREECLGRIDSVSKMPLNDNKDALAFLKMFSEVQKLASPFDKVYLIHLTDTGYTKSFQHSGLTPAAEIDAIINTFRKKAFKKRLHVTLVALTNSVTTYDAVDELCQIPSTLLQDYIGIANVINDSLGKTISKTFK